MIAVKATGPRLWAVLSACTVGTWPLSASTPGPAMMMSCCPAPAPWEPGRSATIHQRLPLIVPVAISPGCAPGPGGWTVTVTRPEGEAGAGPAARCTTEGTPNPAAAATAATPTARAARRRLIVRPRRTVSSSGAGCGLTASKAASSRSCSSSMLTPIPVHDFNAHGRAFCARGLPLSAPAALTAIPVREFGAFPQRGQGAGGLALDRAHRTVQRGGGLLLGQV